MDFSFTKGSRTRILAVVLLGAMVLFTVRLFYVQVIRHGYYVEQADSEQIKRFALHAKRGEIYTYDSGEPAKLVMNETVFTVWADPTQVTDQQKIVDTLNRIAGGNTRKDFSQYLQMRHTRYQVLATKVSLRQANLLKKENLPGIGFDAVTQRVYPEGQLASQVLGFVDADGNGKYGFEQANDEALKGKDGVLKTVTDVRSVPLTIGPNNINTPAKDGKNYVLSIDRYVQAHVEQALAEGVKRSGATNASALVMDPSTGHVLAMANVPTYDPSQLATVSDPAMFNNDVISNPYEPGSDIKTFTVATGLDKGVITPNSTYNNTGQIQIEDITVNNATKNATVSGTITIQTALNWSLNTGMITIAQRLGNGTQITRGARDTIYDYFHNKFRLGERTGVELANEAKGTLISPDEQQGNAVKYSNMSFGQGLDATMMQVTSGFCSIINGGNYMEPTIIAGVMDADGNFKTVEPRIRQAGVIKATTSSTLREMVHEAHYATYKPHTTPEGYFIGGKTGTSQTLENGKYVNDQTIGTYLGFGGEVGKIPRYAIMIDISAKGKALGGGTDAKPIFNDISDWMIQYLKLQPQG